MKYTIHGFQQEQLIKYGLDNDDALILRVIKDMYSSGSIEYEIIDNERFIWIDQSTLLKNIPIVGTKRHIQRRLKKMEDIGLLKRQVLFSKLNKKNNTTIKGSFSYINITKKMDELSEYEGTTNCHTPYDNQSHPLRQSVAPPMTNCRNKDYPIIDYPIIDSINNIYSHFNSKNIIKHRKLTLQISKEIEKAIKKYSEEEIIKAIDHYDEVYKSDFYYSHAWNLEKFLKQSNAISRFTDEGDIWNTYIKQKEGAKNDNNGNRLHTSRQYSATSRNNQGSSFKPAKPYELTEEERARAEEFE